MGEEVEHEGELLEEKSWEFPNIGNNCEKDKSPDMSNSDEGKKRSGGGGVVGDVSQEDHQLHIWTERERRKKMRNMFSNLHALLPHIPPKADKATIVDAAVSYIQRLEQNVDELETQKLERFNCDSFSSSSYKLVAFQSRDAFLAEQGSSTLSLPVFTFDPIFKTWTSPNVILNICGRDGHFNVCCMKKPGLLSTICFVLDKNDLEVVSAQASSHQSRSFYMIHARAIGGAGNFQQALSVEEIFKQAAAEIMTWVNS